MFNKITTAKVEKWAQENNLKKLIKGIQSKNHTVRDKTFSAIHNIENAGAKLKEIYNKANNKIKSGVVSAAAEIRDEYSVQILKETLENEGYELKVQAARALNFTKDKEIIQSLIKTLKYEGIELNRTVSDSLVALKGHSTDLLIEALNKSDSLNIRKGVAGILGRIQAPKAIPHLIKALKDDSALDVRLAAENALKNMGNQAQGELLKALNNEEIRLHICRILGVIGDIKAIDPMIDLLGKEKPEALPATIRALGNIGNVGNKKIVEYILPYLDNQDILKQEIKQLDQKADKEQIAELKKLKREIQQASIETLGKLGDSRTITPIINALQDTYLRNTATYALIHLGNEAVLKAMKQDEWFAKDVTYTLKQLNTKEADKMLKVVQESHK